MSSFKSLILKSIVLPIADIVMKTKISFYYNEIKRLQKFSKSGIQQWQTKKLNTLIAHSYLHCDYYFDLFNSLNLKPEDINSISDLKKLPILTKKVMRDNYIKLISRKSKSIPSKIASTGGSSGDPAVFIKDNNSWSFSVAHSIINWERTGYRYGDKYIALGSTSLFVNKKMSLEHKIYYWLKGKFGLNGVNMSDDVCKYYVELISRKRIRFIYGYASSLYLLAKYVVKNNLSLNIGACYSTSEILTDVYRVTISLAFKCKILDCYGAGDGAISAFEHQQGFYEVGYNSIFWQQSSDENFIGPILVTDLFNYSMPLINYQLGDEIQVIPDNNTHFYNGQIINKVLGRISDVIELENGSVITGPGFTILFKDLPVEYYNIAKTGVNLITCTIKKLPEYSIEHERIIIDTFKKQVGSESAIDIVYTTNVIYSKSGKRQYFSH